jgi:leucyl-tRNA synthetase
MSKAKQGGAWGSPAWEEAVDIYLRMLAPVCPHISEEIWALLGKPYSVHTQAWPQVDEEAAKEELITIVVQVNGKVRDRLSVNAEISDEEVKALALQSEAVQRYLGGKPPRQIIYVPRRLVSIVV